MYESKYRQYITKSNARFAEDEEIISSLRPIDEKVAGVPIVSKDGKIYVDNEDNHTIVIGPTGCKKSRVTAFTTIASIIEAGESAIINDPKGELYKKTAKRAKKLGADVFMVNLRQPQISDCWNPLSQIYDLYSKGYVDEARSCIDEFSLALCSVVKSEKDKYWETTTTAFLSAILNIYMTTCKEKDYFNLQNILPLCYDYNSRYLTKIISKMSTSSGTVVAIRSITDLEARTTRSCLYSTLQSSISVLTQNKSVLKLLSGVDKINFSDFGKKQSLLYIIYPDEKKGMDFIVNMIATQSYQILLHSCLENNQDRLPVRVNYVLDEFSNLAKIENFDNRISEARSKNIRYFLYIQSLNQLKEKYGNTADTIMSNCNNWICFSSKEMELLNNLSKICGNETDYNGNQIPLISPFDMQHLRKANDFVEVLIVKQGQYPYISNLPDFFSTELAKLYAEEENMNGINNIINFNDSYIISPEKWTDLISSGEFNNPAA